MTSAEVAINCLDIMLAPPGVNPFVKGWGVYDSTLALPKQKKCGELISKSDPSQNHSFMVQWKMSGQISIIPKPELRGFGGSSLIKPPFRVTSADVVIICPEMSMAVFDLKGKDPIGDAQKIFH